MIILKFGRDVNCFKNHVVDALSTSTNYGESFNVVSDKNTGGFNIVIGEANDNDMIINSNISSIKYLIKEGE